MNIVEAGTALTEPSFLGGSSQSSSRDGFARRLDDVLADTRGRAAEESRTPADPARQSETAYRGDQDYSINRDNSDRSNGDNHDRGNDQRSADDQDRREHSEQPDREDAFGNSGDEDAYRSQDAEAKRADSHAADTSDDDAAERSGTTRSDDPATTRSADNGSDTGNTSETPSITSADGTLLTGTSDPASIVTDVLTTDSGLPASVPTGLAAADSSEAQAANSNTPVQDLLIPETANPIVVSGLTEAATPQTPVDLSGAAFVAQAITSSNDNQFVNPNSGPNGSTGQVASTAAITGPAAGSNGNGQAGGQAGGGLNFAPTAQANAGNAMNTPASNPDGFANFLESATSASSKATATPAALGRTGSPTISSGSETQSWQTPVTQPNGPAPMANAQAATAPKPAFVPPQPPQVQVAVHIAQAVQQGIDQIKIQLHPADLGRVDVRLDVASDGRVAATVVADRPETLEMLRNDSRGLERALQDAGLRSDAGNLSFNLREQHHGQGDLADESGNGKNGDGSELTADNAMHFNGPTIEGNQVFDIRV